MSLIQIQGGLKFVELSHSSFLGLFGPRNWILWSKYLNPFFFHLNFGHLWYQKFVHQELTVCWNFNLAFIHYNINSVQFLNHLNRFFDRWLIEAFKVSALIDIIQPIWFDWVSVFEQSNVLKGVPGAREDSIIWVYRNETIITQINTAMALGYQILNVWKYWLHIKHTCKST